MITMKHAYKAFKETVVFEDLNFEIDAPGMYFIQGESGSGKSTFLNLLAGYETIDQGEFKMDSNLATIFQNYELIDSMTVRENIFLVNDEASVEEQAMLEQLGLNELMEHRCNELSGGQRQRVGIARALMLAPNIILCDEPMESLDIDNKIVVMELLKKMAKTKIVIVASHDLEMIREYAEVIYKLEHHQLVLYQAKVSDDELVVNDRKTVDKKHVSKRLHKLLRKKSLLFGLLITVLIVFSQGLFVFQKSLFYQPNSKNVVNADMVYIKVNNKDLDVSEFQIKEDALIPIVKFVNVQVNGQEMLSGIYPYVENELEIEGKRPGKDEIIINQNVAAQMKDYEGKELNFVYIIENERLEKTYRVCGVVNEPDTVNYNFYYDLDSLMNELKVNFSASGKLYYDLLVENASYFQMKMAYEKVPTYYHLVEETSSISIESPLYEERMDFERNSAIYKTLFLVFEGIALFVILMLVISYLTIDVKRYLSVFSILVSVQIPIQMVKVQYVKNKLLYFVPMSIIFSGMFIFGYYHQYRFTYLIENDYKFLIMIPVLVLVVYFMMLMIGMMKFKRARIWNVLKDSKD